MNRSKSNGPESNSANPVEVQKALKGMKYPASKQDLIDIAGENDAPATVMEVLEGLSEREYRTPAEVTKEIATMED